MSYEHLSVTSEGATLYVVMNRPERLNALNAAMVSELRALFTELYWNTDIRVVVLRGAGKAFCAGLDLKDRETEQKLDTIGALKSQRGIAEIVRAMRNCPQPIVSLVHGAASGGGFALALASDIRIAASTARMNAAFIRVGLSACDIGVSYFLPRLTNASVAAEYMLTGRFIDAEKAISLGLVSRIVDEADLAEAGQLVVEDMLRAAPLGLRLTKEALNHAIDASSIDAVIAMEDRNQVLCWKSGDFDEGIAAFVEKREPVYGR